MEPELIYKKGEGWVYESPAVEVETLIWKRNRKLKARVYKRPPEIGEYFVALSHTGYLVEQIGITPEAHLEYFKQGQSASRGIMNNPAEWCGYYCYALEWL